MCALLLADGGSADRPTEGSSRSAQAMAAVSTALLAQQLPPLSKFDGNTNPEDDKETVKDWLEQFELLSSTGPQVG